MSTRTLAARLAVVTLFVLPGGSLFGQTPMVLSLGDAARLAARKSAASQSANLQVEQAAARAQQQRAELLPAVLGSASSGERTFNTAGLGLAEPLFSPNGQVLGPVRTLDMRASARWTVLDAGAMARWRAARAGVSAASDFAADVSQQAARAAASAYIEALRADAQLAARVADSVLTSELLTIARNQREAGMGITLDVTRALTQSAAARAQLIAARAARERAQLLLLRSLGLPLDTPVQLADTLLASRGTKDTTSEAQAVGQAMEARFDLRSLNAQSSLIGRQLTATRLERLPTISLFAERGANGSNSAYLLNTYTWGIQASWPLFDGFRREARIAEQRSALRELEIRRRDLEQQVAIEVRTALLDFASAREQLAACDERVALAQEEVAQARERFVQGVAGNADVIAGLASLNAARTQQVDARAAVQLARVALSRATGTITELP